MPTPTEIKESLKDRLAEINASMTNVSEISGISLSALSNFVSGRFGVPLQDLQRLHRCVSAMELLALQAAPLPIDFRNTAKIRDLISKIQKDNLKILVLDFAEQPPTSADFRHGILALSAQV